MFDKLIVLFERLVVALEKIAGRDASPVAPAPADVPASAPATRKRKTAEASAPAPAPTSTPDPDDGDDFLNDDTESKPAYTRDNVRAALVAFQKHSGGAAAPAQRLLKESSGGTTSLGALPEDKFAAVVNAVLAAGVKVTFA